MKIIDAHFHFSRCDHFDELAREAGHENCAAHLAEVYRQTGLVLGVAMGEMGGERIEGVCTPRMPAMPQPYPPFIAWCAGLDSGEIVPRTTKRSLELFAAAFSRPECVGMKLYPGYHTVSLTDPVHDPYYDLAGQYDVPVVIHTGELAGNHGLLKYSHPLIVDELAGRFPQVRFVMAHCGNPWIVDATAVAAKNPNVYLDLSGLYVGSRSADWYWDHFRGHLELLRTWLVYMDNWEKVMYGSDWPLVNIPSYIEVIRRLIPEESREAVFYGNACRVFPKIPALLRPDSQ